MEEKDKREDLTSDELLDKVNELNDKLNKMTRKVNIIFWLVIVAVVFTVLGWWFPTLF